MWPMRIIGDVTVQNDSSMYSIQLNINTMDFQEAKTLQLLLIGVHLLHWRSLPDQGGLKESGWSDTVTMLDSKKFELIHI
jgi:hypothetical protein